MRVRTDATAFTVAFAVTLAAAAAAGTREGALVATVGGVVTAATVGGVGGVAEQYPTKLLSLPSQCRVVGLGLVHLEAVARR